MFITPHFFVEHKRLDAVLSDLMKKKGIDRKSEHAMYKQRFGVTYRNQLTIAQKAEIVEELRFAEV